MVQTEKQLRARIKELEEQNAKLMKLLEAALANKDKQYIPYYPPQPHPDTVPPYNPPSFNPVPYPWTNPNHPTITCTSKNFEEGFNMQVMN